MKTFDKKVLSFMLAISNAYQDDAEKENVPKLEMNHENMTEDFTAMIYAVTMLYNKLTGENEDVIGMIGIMNRLVVQDMMSRRGGSPAE